MIAAFGKYISALPRPLILAAGVFLDLGLGVLDLATGPEISFKIFYLVPLYFVTWFNGKGPGVLISFVSAVFWVLEEVLSERFYSHSLGRSWEVLVWLFFFLITTYLVSELKSSQNRRRLLERIFFHDVLNLATGIRGFAQVLAEGEAVDRGAIAANIQTASLQVINEIETQRVLSSAESHELDLHPTPLNSRGVLAQVVEWYRHYGAAGNRAIVIAPDTQEVLFFSDQVLLSRILGNMVKNALEAAEPGETVTAGCGWVGDMVEFWVHNASFIPRRYHGRIFRPSFSTKGSGRGLGTYSIKLLSEYLRGEVSFTSTERDGTTFRARYPARLS